MNELDDYLSRCLMNELDEYLSRCLMNELDGYLSRCLMNELNGYLSRCWQDIEAIVFGSQINCACIIVFHIAMAAPKLGPVTAVACIDGAVLYARGTWLSMSIVNDASPREGVPFSFEFLFISGFANVGSHRT